MRSWSAICVGIFFSGVTTFVLLEDTLRHGAPFTTKHLMTMAVLAGTIYFGHRWWTEFVAWRIGTMLGCAVLFTAGTVTCVLMSAGRNAEVVTNKVLTANAANTERERVQTDRDEAKARYLAAMKAEEAECATGQGEKCWGKRTTTKLRREDLETAEKALREQKPEQIANADIKAAAQLVARLPYVTVQQDRVEALLLLLYPFLLSLFCEAGAIVGLSIGLGHRRAAPKPKPQTDELRLPTVRDGSVRSVRELKTLPVPKEQAERDLITYIALNGSVPSQDFLRDRWRLGSKSTVSEWLAEWEAKGLIARHREGKRKVTTTVRSRTEAH